MEKTFDLRGRKLFVATPTYDHRISIKSSIAMMQLAILCAKEGIALGHHPVCGCSIISSARNTLADMFLQSDATDLLFLDSDINFDPRDVLRLLAMTTERGIVAGVPRRRDVEEVYLVKFAESPEGNLIFGDYNLIKADRVATSFMMVQRKVFETLRDNHPEWQHPSQKLDKKIYAFFDFSVTPEGYMGEDYLFCERARAHGFEVWVDPVIKLGHMGLIEFEGDLKQAIISKAQQAAADAPPLDSAA